MRKVSAILIKGLVLQHRRFFHPPRMMVQTWFLATLLGALACAVAPRAVIVGEPKWHIENGLYVSVPAPSRVALKSIRWLWEHCEELAVASLKKIGIASSAITATEPDVRVISYDAGKNTIEAIANAVADGFDSDSHHHGPLVTLVYLNYSPKVTGPSGSEQVAGQKRR